MSSALARPERALRLRPVFHRRQDRIRAHVQLCWLALLLICTIDLAVDDTWRNTRHQRDRMHLVTLEPSDGRIAQRPATTASEQQILRALKVAEPRRFLDLELPNPVA